MGSASQTVKRVGAAMLFFAFALSMSCLFLQGCSSTKSGDASSSVGTAALSSASIESEASSASASSKAIFSIVVPDLVGQNLADVKDVLDDFDVEYLKADGSRANVFVSSNWRVDQQSLEPGTEVEKGATLTLTLGHITEEKAAEEKAEADARKAEERASIDYVSVSASQLVDDLNANAMTAKEKYKDGYYRVTGVVSNIDASGKYIDLDPEGAAYNFTFIQCYLNDEAAKDAVRQISKGDIVTICGQITDVGEVLGYSIDVYFFE